MNRTLKLSFFCAGIFACGVVVGGLGAKKHFARPPAAGPGNAQPASAPEGFGPHQLRRLTAELALTEPQQAAIAPVLEKAGEELRQLRRESFRQSSAIIEAMETVVAANLTPEQKVKLAALQEEQRARIKAKMEERNRRRAEGGERREGEPPPPPPPRPEAP
ncbi:MAG: hypothetical protein MUE42_01795 [Opitutaceae bacterium]|jgi:Spy/CpxP family protein refolding chaperone|nr:hypothetical protein [Opitutaceae bacterium]